MDPLTRTYFKKYHEETDYCAFDGLRCFRPNRCLKKIGVEQKDPWSTLGFNYATCPFFGSFFEIPWPND